MKKYLRAYSFQPQHIVLFAFLITALNAIICLFNGYVFDLNFPNDTFLFSPKDRFADFLKFMDNFKIVDTWPNDFDYDGAFFPYTMPLSSLFYVFFSYVIKLFEHPIIVYFGYILSLLFIYFICLKSIGHTYTSIGLSILTYPMIFCIDRGNYAILIVILIMLALTMKSKLSSIVLISIATLLRITPFIYFLPLILKSKYSFKSVFLFCLVFILSLISFHYLALFILDNTLNNQFNSAQNLFSGLDVYQKNYIERLDGLQYGSSLYMPFRYVMDYTPFYKFGKVFMKPIYFPIILFLLSGLLLLRRFSLKELINKFCVYDKILFILTYSIIVFPPVTADYYLLLLLIPLFIISNSRYSFGYFISLGLLLAAKNIIFVGDGTVSLQIFINPLLLLLLILGELELIPMIKRTLVENT
jgi:hypothetical protein